MRMLAIIKRIIIRYPRLTRMSRSSPTILFLFRNIPDFDHMVPVAYKLSEISPDLKIIFCCTDIRFAFHQTRLSRFLTEDLGVKCIYLHELCAPTLFHRWFSKYLIYLEGSTGGILSKIFHRIDRKILKQILYDSCYFHYFIERENIRSIIIDTLASCPKLWPHPTWFHGEILPVASKHGISVCWMQHAPPTTKLQIYSDKSNGTIITCKWINTFLVCSEWTKRALTSNGIKAKDIKVVGNSRYCQEWLKKWGDYCRITNCEMNTHQKIRLKVIMLESAPHRIILDEYLDLIKALVGLEWVDLKVLPHPRSTTNDLLTKRHPLAKCHPELIIKTYQPSTNMVQWCDVAIVVHSSLAWECLERNKYLIHVEYIYNRQFDSLFSNRDRHGIGLYGANTEEVLTRLQDIQTGKVSRPMDNPAYLRLRKNIIYGGLEEDSVLKRHVEEIST